MSGDLASVNAPDAAAPSPTAAILKAGGPELPGLMEATERRLEQVAAEGGVVLGEHAALTLSAGGKRLRPLLVFLCAGPAGGHDALPAAVAVELLHMATLVHDDVLDRAELRRGNPTVFVTGGRGAATATGDLLFSRAFAELAATGSATSVGALSEASSALAGGELMQRADAFSHVGAERYLERCRLKTARLFEAAARIGALLGEPGERGAAALAAFGTSVGLAFQILDDVLDVAGPVERTGKQRGTDLLDGTVTLPMIVARRVDPALGELDLRSVADTAEAEAVCDRIAATGALERSRAIALDHVEDAKRTVRDAALPAASTRALELVADGVVERYS